MTHSVLGKWRGAIVIGVSVAAHAVAITVGPRLDVAMPLPPKPPVVSVRLTPAVKPTPIRQESPAAPSSNHPRAAVSGPLALSQPTLNTEIASQPLPLPTAGVNRVPELAGAPTAAAVRTLDRPSLAVAELPATAVMAPPLPTPTAALPTPTAALPTPAPSMAVPDDGRYPTDVRRLLEAERRYPARSRRRGEEGVVRIAFAVDAAGRVRDVEVLESSGHSTLDRATVELVQRCEPLPAPPAPARLEFSILYELRDR